MKAVCVKSYYDKVLKRKIAVGDVLELSSERFKELSTTSNAAKTVLVKERQKKEMSTTEKEG